MNAEKAVMISRIPKSSVLAVMVSPFDADKALHTSEMSQNKCKKCAQSGICLCLCVSVLCKNKHITYGRVSLALVRWPYCSIHFAAEWPETYSDNYCGVIVISSLF